MSLPASGRKATSTPAYDPGPEITVGVVSAMPQASVATTRARRSPASPGAISTMRGTVASYLASTIIMSAPGPRSICEGKVSRAAQITSDPPPVSSERSWPPIQIMSPASDVIIVSTERTVSDPPCRADFTLTLSACTLAIWPDVSREISRTSPRPDGASPPRSISGAEGDRTKPSPTRTSSLRSPQRRTSIETSRVCVFA
jgi:hypothetical protein